MLVIIGGSGMLFEASRILTERHAEPVLLCGRQEARYQPILSAQGHARFFSFDFSAAADYARLRQYLRGEDAPLTFLLWIHSPYYPYLADLLKAVEGKVRHVFLVRGSAAHPLPPAWQDGQKMTVIRLGKHPTENRWLSHAEICRQVLEAVDGVP